MRKHLQPIHSTCLARAARKRQQELAELEDGGSAPTAEVSNLPPSTSAIQPPAAGANTVCTASLVPVPGSLLAVHRPRQDPHVVESYVVTARYCLYC
ncbi:hypothetical protein NDU88_001710 [Pleurodeles waltl]|uniref:Uncharacterized protein n=1 Tax=Pleurodeles waltl TaxID=8319 RepID=A0AAV7UU42_PLEWA|nr:hypothetical protein NDU88_001710 [Pleurodeles waltl]